jgi:hypothetical protein
MSRIACVFALLLLTIAGAEARHWRHYEDETVLNVGGLQFQIPDSWQPQTPETGARAGQWLVPPRDTGAASDSPAEGVEVVAFFFGPNVGGTVQENIDGWSASVTTPDGHPATAAPAKRTVSGHAITEVLLTGTYAKSNPEPGLPPTPKPGYALIGVVIENPAGTIYWRATGPSSQVALLAPALDRMIDGLQPHAVEAASSSP